MQCFWHYYTTILLLIKVLITKSIASMICPNGYANNEFYSLLYGLGYGTLAQIILMIIILISISFCSFCFLFAGILYVRQKMKM
ncbi:unnamed protein product [Brugia pahangi]|uniref:Uncharacterized protein n=1 Tax=Brugia pahangi TaxID=6280 RepID=A0A0N4TCE4_BRUPA|nr:unnamed protein product [Brugia pahangi]